MSIDNSRPPVRGTTLNKSIRAKSSSRIRPSSATNSSRRYSVAPAVPVVSATLSPGQSPSRKPSINASRRVSNANANAPTDANTQQQQPRLTQSLNRKSMRRASSSTDLLKQKLRTGTTETQKLSSPARTSIYASMRRPSVVRESTQLGSTLHRKSMRKMSKGAPPPAMNLTTEPPVSPSRRSSTLKRVNSGGTLRRMSSSGEMTAAFDHVSAQASV